MGEWSWAAIGTALGIVTNVIILGVALWQGRITARSAQAAADAAKTTELAYELQKQQWDESRRADLRILSTHRVFERQDVYFELNVRNVGKSPAYWPELKTYYRGGVRGLSLGHPNALMPETERRFRAIWLPPPQHEVVDSVYWLKLVLSYEDGHGRHELEAVYRFTDFLDPGTYGEALARLSFDGNVLEEWISNPEDTSDAERMTQLREGQLLIPDDL
jgi:hypothetical protein